MLSAVDIDRKLTKLSRWDSEPTPYFPPKVQVGFFTGYQTGGTMKLVSLRLVAAIAICLGVAQSSAVFGTPAAQPLFFTPASTSVPQVMDAINSAKKSFHMIMYRISTVAVMDALIAAKNRGVDVQVILDNAGATSEKPTGAFHTLSAAGVKVMKSSSLFSISHVKAFVVDNKTAYIMTLKLTTISPTVRDVGLISTDSN